LFRSYADTPFDPLARSFASIWDDNTGEPKPLVEFEPLEMELISHPPIPILGQTLPIPGIGSEVSKNSTASPDGPSAPREVAAVFVSTRFVTLTWKAPIDPNGRIIAYAILYKGTYFPRTLYSQNL